MTFDLATAATAFAVIFPVELPDKTFVATLVLATRYRPLAVWVGVAGAFLVQCAVAVSAGGLIGLLPERVVLVIATILFGIGAVVLLRGASRTDDDAAEEEAELRGRIGTGGTSTNAGRTSTGRWRAVGASFAVLFAAEWGDLSQLFTAGLAARTGDPVSVFVGSWLALVSVAGLAVVLGRSLRRYVRLSTVRRIGGGVCAVLALVTAAAALGVTLG